MLREPRQALVPSAFSVQAAEKWALHRSRKLPDRLLRLTDFWYINFVRQPAPGERKTRYTMKIAQSENYGSAVGLSPALPAPALEQVGKDVRHILRARLYRDTIEQIAFVDLIMGHVSRTADKQIVLDGGMRAKYVARSQIFADEAERILQHKCSRKFNRHRRGILVIGATAAILSALLKRGFHVTSTDLRPEIVGNEFGGVRVLNGKAANAELMKEADLAIITGMALVNRTLPSLIALAKTHNTSTMMWAVTGRNFGHYYTQNGVDSVISDPSPFLLLPGRAVMEIWRRSK